LRNDAAGETRIATKDIVRITAAVSTAHRDASEHELTLAGGDTLRGRLVRTDGDSLVVETADFGTISIPLESVSDIVMSPAESSAFRQSAEWFSRGKAGDEDRVLLTNGDIVRGFITALDAQEIRIDAAGEAMRVSIPLVVAVRFASSKATRNPQTFLTVTFDSSGRFSTADFNWSPDEAQLRTRAGTTLACAAEQVARVDVLGGRWEWLSEHAPMSAVQTPMLALDWPLVKDRNVRGGPIAVAHESFERGLGVHSRSHLTYELGGAYREFVTSFGLDDDSGPLADVAVRILVDGRSRFEQPEVHRGKLYGPVRLDVRRANRIELIVEFGKNGDLQDRFNWVEPALIRE